MLAELSVYARDISPILAKIHADAKEYGTIFHITKLLPNMIAADGLPVENQKALANFMSACGLRKTAQTWADSATERIIEREL